MPRFIISFDDGDMTFPMEELQAVADASHATVREAQAAGVWIFGGGLGSPDEATLVRADGTATDGARNKAYLGGFSIVDVPSRQAALAWAEKFAVSCRCAQEVREILPDREA